MYWDHAAQPFCWGKVLAAVEVGSEGISLAMPDSVIASSKMCQAFFVDFFFFYLLVVQGNTENSSKVCRISQI